MNEFEDIQSLYSYLEENALKYKYHHQISDLFRALRDILSKDEKSFDAEKAQWEVDFFNFVLTDGEIKPSIQSTDEKGNIIEYPSFDRFNEQTYKYLKNRFNSTNNNLLKSRYAHILWFSPAKNGKYAQAAIDCYIELNNVYEEKDKSEPNEHYGLSVLLGIKNAYYLARQANDSKRINLIIDKIKKLIYSYNERSSSLLTMRADLIQLMLDDKVTFDETQFINLNDLCIQVADTLFQSGNGFRAISFFELGEKIEKRLGLKTYDYRTSIAECFEMMMKQNENEPVISITHCQNAIECYKKAKNNAKIKELEINYRNLKNSLRLESIEYKIDQTEHIEKCIQFSEELISKNSPDNIIGYLALHKDLLPTYKDMDEQAEQQSKSHPILDIFPTIILDQNAHPAQTISTENVKFYKILQHYKMHLEISKLPLINYLLIESIKQRKLSPQLMLNFLQKYSWLSITQSKPLPNGEIFEYNWLNLLAPAINEYFLQMNYYLYSKNYPNFVLAIDSLTLKIEGILRDYCNNAGIVTFFQRTDKNGTNVQEKDINALLHEPKLADHFSNDDILLFKFILVEKAGYNLRHKVAHSLMSYADYDISIIHILILILLRLSKI